MSDPLLAGKDVKPTAWLFRVFQLQLEAVSGGRVVLPQYLADANVHQAPLSSLGSDW